MKLLFDQNLSHRSAMILRAEFPDSDHVRNHGFAIGDDRVIWYFAAATGFTIVTKDRDFALLSAARGQPPKVVWIDIGNCPRQHIEDLLRARKSDIEQFGADAQLGLYILD